MLRLLNKEKESTLLSKVLTGVTFALAASLPASALAGGWVKAPGAFYTKVGYAFPEVQQTRPSGSGAEKLDTTTSSYSVYGEAGLPFWWPVQLNISAAYKEIVVSSITQEDEFKSASFTDAQLVSSHQVYSGNPFESFALGVATSGRLGLVLPTTPKDFRLGNEKSRLGSLPEGRLLLVSPVDRGVTSLVIGSGLSLSFAPVWASFDFDLTTGWDGEFASRQATIALGVGLPFNSWFQLSATETKSRDAIDAPKQALGQVVVVSNSETSQLSASLGVTVYDGIALEGGVNYNVSPDENIEDWLSYTAGISYRSL